MVGLFMTWESAKAINQGLFFREVVVKYLSANHWVEPYEIVVFVDKKCLNIDKHFFLWLNLAELVSLV